uniref:Uncharacterized protein n=1 Tax=Cucumis melo TaxID=3656 RepID=A0A9I9DWW9_CUCME
TDKQNESNRIGSQIINTTAYSATAADPNTEKVIEAAPLPDGAGASAGGEEIEEGEVAGDGELDGEVEGEVEGGDGGDFKEEGVGANAGEDLGDLTDGETDGALDGDWVGD